MNQSHPVTLELLAKAHRADLAAEARNQRLVRETRQIGKPTGADHQIPVLSLIRASRVRLTASLLAGALALGAVAGVATGTTSSSGDPGAGAAPAAPAAGSGGGGGAGRPLLR